MPVNPHVRCSHHKLATLLALSALACGDDTGKTTASSTKTTDTTKTHADAGVQSPDAGETSAQFAAPYHVSITVPDVAPGVEGTRCVKVRLENAAPINIAKIHNVLGAHSHHFVLSMVDDPSQTEQELYECPPFRAPLTGAPLTVTQKSDEQITLPQGVGYALGEHQLMHLELHYINASSETADVSAQAELYPLRSDEPVQRAGFMIVGDLNIKIPPHTMYSNGDVYAAQPKDLAGVHYYAVTGHTHRLGKMVRVGVADAKDADTNWIYEPPTFDWDAPPVQYLEPALQIPDGGGFHLRCDWDNTTDDTVLYGESALTEMCFFWVYYYPRNEEQKVILAGFEDSMYAKDGGTPP
jgi:hypothetical protein